MNRPLLTGLVVVLVASCHSSTGVPIQDLDAIRVAVRVAPTTVANGTTASVVLTLTNTASRPVEMSACPIYFWVQGSKGQIVGGSDLLYCLAGSFVYQPLVLKPFETKTMAFAWLAGETVVVPPGQYDVFGWVNDPAHRSAPTRITVQSAN